VQEAGPLVVTATRRIEAPAPTIFELLADPRRHLEIDGSGMLRGTEEAQPIGAVGDQFVMSMYYEQFGDYTMLNRVVEFEKDRRIAWEPMRIDIESDDDWHHRWGYDLEPDGDATMVTEFFDCTRAPEEGQKILKGGETWADAMRGSLERLDSVVTGGARSS
jgi:uncharacterized protein YndB with AHSA1/START domain